MTVVGAKAATVETVKTKRAAIFMVTIFRMKNWADGEDRAAEEPATVAVFLRETVVKELTSKLS